MVWSHSVFRDSGVAQLVVGPAGRISVANPAAHALVGRNSLAGTDLAELITVADRASLDAFLATLTNLGAGRSQAFGPVHLADRVQRRPVQMVGSRTQGDGGFDALVVAMQELPTAAAPSGDTDLLVDPLTGVGTRTRGLQALEQAVSPQAPGCLLVVDLDGFGWLNESFGYAEGDRILVEVAQRLLRAVPPGATVSRIDGDQFLVVSPNTLLADSIELAKVVMWALAAPMHIAGTRVVTVSVGGAGLAGSSAQEALTRAYAALTAAKRQGGQQVVVDGPVIRVYGRRDGDLHDPGVDAHVVHIDAAQAEAEQAKAEAAQAKAEAAQAKAAADIAHGEARTDQMTGLPNFLAFTETAESIQRQARTTTSPVAVLFVDVDEFGLINKAHSWEEGTRRLTSVARVLASQCRGHDRVFRYGGDEFVVLQAGTDLAGALMAAERLRAAVEAAEIPHNGDPTFPIVTLSVGVAADSGPRLDIADLVNQADSLSQRAKSNGRNRVLPEPDPTPPSVDRV